MKTITQNKETIIMSNGNKFSLHSKKNHSKLKTYPRKFLFALSIFFIVKFVQFSGSV